MTVREMQDEILRIKKEKDICILAHAYQRQDILDIADFVGDSFALSQMAAILRDIIIRRAVYSPANISAYLRQKPHIKAAVLRGSSCCSLISARPAFPEWFRPFSAAEPQ